MFVIPCPSHRPSAGNTVELKAIRNLAYGGGGRIWNSTSSPLHLCHIYIYITVVKGLQPFLIFVLVQGAETSKIWGRKQLFVLMFPQGCNYLLICLPNDKLGTSIWVRDSHLNILHVAITNLWTDTCIIFYHLQQPAFVILLLFCFFYKLLLHNNRQTLQTMAQLCNSA